MTDLVKKLERLHKISKIDLLKQAADRIKELEAEVEELNEQNLELQRVALDG